MDKRRSLRTHLDLLEKIAHPGKVLFHGAVPHLLRAHCDFPANIQRLPSANAPLLSGAAPSPIRYTSGLDPARLRFGCGAACGATLPIRNRLIQINAKKALKRPKKRPKNEAKMRIETVCRAGKWSAVVLAES